MQLSDYILLTQDEKEQINEFVIDNIETIYDRRDAYGTRIDLNSKHLTVLDDKNIKNEFVEDNFVGYFCNICHDWVEGISDIILVDHVLKHIRGEPLEDEEVNEFRNEILEYAHAVDEIHKHTSIEG